MAMSTPTLKTIWNMDEAVLKSIHCLKVKFIFLMERGEYEEAYWTLRHIRMEIDSKLKDEEQKNAEEKIKELEQSRRDFINNKNTETGKFCISLEVYYILLNRYMKKHGLYFRENDDPRYAVLQR